MTDSEKPQRTPRFEPGAKVRVKYGVTDPDFEDIPLGGWAGTIETVEIVDDQVTCKIAWDRKTLDGMHPVYKNRCERDGLELETMWLTEEDVEFDDGTQVRIEQPTKIVTPPLSEKDQDDRVRKALGLTHDDPLPEIGVETLLAYHRYLSATLKFPFTAYCGVEEVGPFSHRRATMTVTALLDPRRGLSLDDGLVSTARDREDEIDFPLADIEVKSKKNAPNFRLLSDYAYWFHNWPCNDESDIDLDAAAAADDDEEIESEIRPQSGSALIKVTLILGVVGCLLGATIGAALETLSGAGIAAKIGGVPLGMIGAFLLGRYGSLVGAVNRVRYQGVLGAIFGGIAGGLVGVVAALTIVALPWSLLGFLAGLFLGPYVLPREQRRSVSFRVASFGACAGIVFAAFRHDQARAAAGAVSGAITGLAVAPGLFLLLLGAVYLSHSGDLSEFETTRATHDD